MRRDQREHTYVRRVGRAIRKLRTERGLSQEKLAHRAHLHRTYIGAVERGERNITIVSLFRIASAFGVSPAVILREAEEPNGESKPQF